MSEHAAPSERISVVSIHGRDERGMLSFDVSQVLEAILDIVEGYVWVASWIDCVGEATIPERVPLTTSRLAEIAREVRQTVDGVFMGYPRPTAVPPNIGAACELEAFPTSPATVAIVAFDSTCFEVITKNPEVIPRLKGAFRDVRDEDVDRYF